MDPSLMEIRSTVPPAFSTASRGRMYSIASTPSAARKATFLSRSGVAIAVTSGT
jgi:hypothetical protein